MKPAVFVAAMIGLLGATDNVAGQQSEQQTDTARQFAALDWQEGPTKGDIGGIATIVVPAGYRFVAKGGAGKFMEITQNPSDGSELGVLLNEEAFWFVVFEFSADGYVKDDDRDLDADALLRDIREGTVAANKIRRDRGWATLEVVGWQQKPFYDSETKNLTWAIRGQSEGDTSVNHSTRLLGRRGVLKLNLVMSPEDAGEAVPALQTLVRGFSFNPGHRYAEFTRGDKVAEYGLTGLIAGGAGVALVKTGLLQKFWKLIVLGVILLGGALKRFFSSLTRGRHASDQPSHE